MTIYGFCFLLEWHHQLPYYVQSGQTSHVSSNKLILLLNDVENSCRCVFQRIYPFSLPLTDGIMATSLGGKPRSFCKTSEGETEPFLSVAARATPGNSLYLLCKWLHMYILPCGHESAKTGWLGTPTSTWHRSISQRDVELWCIGGKFPMPLCVALGLTLAAEVMQASN